MFQIGEVFPSMFRKKKSMSSLLDLPSEVFVAILCHLCPPDLCSVALVCHQCRSQVAEEEVWVAQAQALARVELRPTPTFSPRQFYQVQDLSHPTSSYNPA